MTAPRIELLNEKKMIGQSLKMTLGNDQTFRLWSGLMPRRKELKNAIGSDLYSIQLYDKLYTFDHFTMNTFFVKWAAVEVTNFDNIPKGMKSLTLEEGLYAVFIHKGMVQDFPITMNFIFKKWLPTSIYQLDDRPHFEILGKKYKNNDPNSEEEVWIPIKVKEKGNK